MEGFLSEGIRLAVAAERRLLEALQWRASLANDGDREALLAHPDAIALPPEQIEAGLVFVALEAAVPVGFAAVLDRDDGDLELDGLFVDPIAQRRGIGRRLVEYCVAFARARDCRAIHVVGNVHAAQFYRALGFVRSGTSLTRFGPAPLLVLKLA